MAVKVDDRHRPVSTVDGSKQWQGDGVVSAERDDARQGPSVLRGPLLVRRGCRGPRENAVVAILDLLKSIGVVVRGNGNISTVNDRGPAVERVCVEWHVITTTSQGMSH